MIRILRISLVLVFGFWGAQQLGAQCNLPLPPGTGPQGCINAPLFCSEADFDGYCSATGPTGASQCPGPFCGTCENNHWFSFIAGSTTISLTITPSNCMGNGLQAQMYATSDCSSFTAVSNCESPNAPVPITVTANNLTVGQAYYLMIDGWAGAQCEYVITVNQGIGNAPSPIISPPITGPLTVCPGVPFNYSVQPVVGVSNYNWTLTPAIGAISNNGTNSINITFGSAGTAQLCVTASNACETGNTICTTVVSANIPPTIIPVSFCFGQTVVCSGNTITSPGQYTYTYDSWQGCDSVVTCIATAIPPIVMPPFQAAICEGGSYAFAGNTYNATGGYPVTLTAANGCDSVVTLLLLVIGADAVIQPPALLGCGSNASIVLNGSSSTTIPAASSATLTYSWTGPGIVSGGNTLTPTVNQPGTYTLTVTHTYLGVSCTDQASVTVNANTATPNQPSVTGPLNACTGTTSTYTVTPAGSGPVPTGYTWTATGGTVAPSGTTGTVTWTTAGQGQICVTANNDCGPSPQACLTVNVGQSPQVPTLTGPDLVCIGDQVYFIIDPTDPTTTSYNWTVGGNASFTDLGDSILVNFSGAMSGQICVTGTNSCGTTAAACIDVTVETLPAQPVVTGVGSVCNGEVANYSVAAIANATSYNWTVPAGATIASGQGTTNISIDWTSASSGNVCVRAVNACGQSPQACFPVTVNPAPTGVISGSGSFCVGNPTNINLTITLTGSSPWDLEYAIDGVVQPQILGITSSPYTLTTDVAGVYTLVSLDNIAPCPGVISGTATIAEDPLPSALISGSGAICQGSGDCVDLQILLTGTAPWTVVVTRNGVPQAPITGITDNPYTFQACQGGDYSIESVTDDNGCTEVGAGNATVTINTAPTVSNIQIECNPTSTGYTVSFTINGGDPSSYTVDGSTVGISAGPPYVFTSAEIPNFTGYSFVVDDGNNCSPLTVSQAIILCDCISSSGDMDQTPLSDCGETACITAIYDNTDEELDGDDALQFILHTGSGLTIVNEVARNVMPTFCFDAAAGMTYGTTYYISVVVGNDLGGGVVDLADPCLSVAQGTPVVFYQTPEGVLSGDAVICIGQSTTLTVNFVGPAPYSISYDDGTTVQTVNGINANPYTFNVSPATTTTYTLTAVSNDNCPGTASGSATVEVNLEISVTNVQAACNSTNTQYVVSFEISGGDAATYTVLPAGLGTLTGGSFVSDPIPTGSGYSFQVADINSCNVIDISDPEVICDCTSAVGEMDLNLIEECGDGPITGIYNSTGQNFDGDDILEFVLHTGSGNAIEYPIIARSPTPEFSFDPGLGMTYNTTYYISAIVGSDDGTGIINDMNDPCLAVAPGTPIVFRVVPTASLSGTQEICLGSNATLPILLTGDSPWTIEVSDGTTTQTISGINSTTYNYVITQPQATATYTLVSVNDEFCPGTVSGSATVTVNAVPVNTLPVVTINATNTGYELCFEISGGTGGPYTVTDGTQVWTVDDLFCSDELPCGDGYYFEFDDGSGCGPIIVSQSVVTCPCTTTAGEMDQTPLTICGSGPAVTIYDDTNQVLDGNDVVDFMLHNGNNVPIQTNSIPSFNFSGSLTYGTTYFISARVGNNSGGGSVDDTDPCLAIAPGTPVVFYQIPTATLAGGGDFCVGDPVDLTLTITGGVAPWTVTYTNTQMQQVDVVVLSSPYTFQLSPDNSTIYSLISVSDANCVGTNVSGLAPFTQQDQPFGVSVTSVTDANNEFVTVCFTIIGGDPATWSVTGGPGTITGDQFCSDPIPCGQGAYQFFVEDAFGCGIDAIEGPISCPCVSGAGVMGQSVQAVCQDGTATANAATGTQFDGNDVLMYALHTASGPSLGTILATGATPSFSFIPGTMTCGTTYYISSVVGNNDGAGQVDLSDPCLSVAVGTPVVFNCLPTASISGGGPICFGQSVEGFLALPATGAYNVTLSDGAQTITLPAITNGYVWNLNPMQTTTYTLVSVENVTTGCTSAATGSITVAVNFPVDAGTALPPVELCANESQAISLASLLTGADADGVWTETTPIPSTGGAFNAVAGTFNTVGQQPGTYTFRYFLDAVAPCPDDAEIVTVIVNPQPVADAGTQQALTCGVLSATIGGSGTSQGPEYIYEWTILGQPGVVGTQSTLTVTQAGTYVLTVTNTQTGCNASSQVGVSEDIATPEATVVSEPVSCFGDADGFIFISSVTGGKPPYLYSINGGTYSGQQQFANLAGGDYLITVQDANGCESSVLINVFEPQELTATLVANLQPDNEGNYFINLGDDLTLLLQSSFPIADLDTIIWSPADLITCNDVFCSSVTTAPTEGATFTVRVERGPCVATDNLRVLVRKPRPVFIPNIFSPNDDGQNDVFYIQAGRQVQQIKSFLVFNRWGEKVFEAFNFAPNDISIGWNGYHRGKRVDPGVFTYYTEVLYIDGYVEMIKGDVTLIR